jgi:TRAP-type mannitol/chloroaromatic compound transport system permease small subunit
MRALNMTRGRASGFLLLVIVVVVWSGVLCRRVGRVSTEVLVIHCLIVSTAS